MKIINEFPFTYKNNQLFCEDVPVNEIIKETDTPVYIYSKNYFKEQFLKFQNAFRSIDKKIFFACKSNFNLNVIKIFSDLGSGVDVNSKGEMLRALKAGVEPKNLIMSGVGKTEEEIRFSLEKELMMLKAESEEEVIFIDSIAGEMNKIAPVALRVNPDVDAKSHPYISTGLSENKFGVDTETAIKIFRNYKNYKHIKFAGIDMHIGSQITTISPFVDAVKKLSEVYKLVEVEGLKLDHFDIGGGIGVSYDGEKTFEIDQLAELLIPLFKELKCEILFEPGRFLTANGGILVSKVLYTKNNNGKKFLITDGAMNDLLRPSIYGAYHHIQPINISSEQTEVVDIVGPVCESGDFLGKNREIYLTNRNDLLAVMSAGAYGIVMSSNYNARRRVPEVIVDGNRFYLTRKRETFDELMFSEEVIVSLHNK